MPRLLLAFAFVLACAAQTPAPPPPPPCKVIPVAGTNADAIAARLDAVVTGVAVKSLSSSSVLVCASDATILELTKAIQQLSSSEPLKTESHSIRLFFSRNAAEIAKVLDQVFPKIKVEPLGTDTLVFHTSALDQEANIHELKRWIAIIDSPRPEVTLNVWSVQLSSKNLPDLSEDSARVRAVVARQNEQLHQALERGWNDISQQIENLQEDYYDKYFSRYISFRVGADVARPTSFDLQSCERDTYCLGFGGAFRPLRPALTHMLGVLAAAAPSKSGVSLADRFVDCLEGLAGCTSTSKYFKPGPPLPAKRPSALGGCEADDEEQLRQSPAGGAAFHCFREQLNESLQPRRKALLRAAFADFLFNYKFSVQYPHDFASFDYAASSQALDSQFDPLLVAFNRDVAVFLKHMQDAVADKESKLKGISFSSNGVVTVRTISGTETQVDTTAQNSFQTTPPPLAQDFLKQLGDAEKNDPALLKDNLASKGSEALVAFLNSGKAATVSLGRAFNLKVTPVSLPGAGAAELKIRLETKDAAAPQIVNPDGSTKNDTTDRLSSQVTDTNVRVESLRLFEVSSFSASLSRGRDPIPLLPPFVSLPYIGSFLNWKPSPSTVFHRSFAIVSAVVVPTAADLLSGIRFLKDDESMTAGKLDAIRDFHRRKLACIALQTMGGGADCAGLKMEPVK